METLPDIQRKQVHIPVTNVEVVMLSACPVNQGEGPQRLAFMAGSAAPYVTSDAWCRNTSNVVPPALVMGAHTAPLGITFFGAPELSRICTTGCCPKTSPAVAFPGCTITLS